MIYEVTDLEESQSVDGAVYLAGSIARAHLPGSRGLGPVADDDDDDDGPGGSAECCAETDQPGTSGC